MEERFEMWPFQRLFSDQAFTDHDQALFILFQDAMSFLEGSLNDHAHLLVNLACRLLAIVPLLAKIATQKDQLLFMAQSHGTNALTHTILGHHRACHFGYALDIV